MSDHYTFITGIIFNNADKAERLEKELEERRKDYGVIFERLYTAHGNPFFAGYFKNLGGGPWPEMSHFAFDEDIELIVFRDDGEVWKNDELLELQSKKVN